MELLASILLVSLPLIVLNSSLKDPQKGHTLNAMDVWVLKIMEPFQVFGSSFGDWTRSHVDGFLKGHRIQQDNEALRVSHIRMKEELRLLHETQEQNRHLRAMFGMRDKLKHRLIGAEIVARDFWPYFRLQSIQLEQGLMGQIKAGMPVIAEHGLLGEVYRVHDSRCDIKLTVDQDMIVDVVVERSGAIGVMRGTGSNQEAVAHVEILEGEDVRVGDVLHTSGLGQKFPSGILVGRVMAIEQKKPALMLKVQPSVDPARLSVVFVLAGSEP